MTDLTKSHSHFLPLIIGGIALILFLSIMLYGLISGRSSPGNEPVPLLKAEGPLKTAPDGLHIRPEPHRNITVFDVFDENKPDNDEGSVTLLEKTEEPNFTQIQNDEEVADAILPQSVSAQTDIAVTEPTPTDAPKPQADTDTENQTAAVAVITEPEKPLIPQTPISGFFIQLAAFADETTAVNQWKILQKAHADLLREQPHLVQKWTDDSSNKIFYRLLIGPFVAQQKADILCQKLHNLEQNCFVRKLPTGSS